MAQATTTGASSVTQTVDALDKTYAALQDIQKHVEPLLYQLRRPLSTDLNWSTKAAPEADTAAPVRRRRSRQQQQQQQQQHQQRHDRALAQAGLALTLGTLRFLGARLSGQDVGRLAEDPLRKELNHMRSLLVALEQRKHKPLKADQLSPTPSSRNNEAAAVADKDETEPNTANQKTDNMKTNPSNRKRIAKEDKAVPTPTTSRKKFRRK